MPRWVFLLGVGVVLVSGVFVVTCETIGPSPGVTETNVRRITPGMTREEVERIFGGPAAGEAMPHDKGNGARCYYWEGERLGVWIDFYPNGAVADHPFFQTQGEPSPPLERLRAWLGW